MREGSAHEAIAGMSDVAVSSLVQRLWESRDYEATLGFSGPNPHVEAVGATSEGTTRTVRTRVVAGGTTARDLHAFAARCDRDGVEPHVVALRPSIGYDTVPVGVAVFDAPVSPWNSARPESTSKRTTRPSRRRTGSGTRWTRMAPRRAATTRRRRKR